MYKVNICGIRLLKYRDGLRFRSIQHFIHIIHSECGHVDNTVDNQFYDVDGIFN